MSPRPLHARSIRTLCPLAFSVKGSRASCTIAATRSVPLEEAGIRDQRRRSGGKRVALWSVAGGLLVMVAVGFAAKDRIREEWYLYRLETGSAEQRMYAIRELETGRSLRAIPKLVSILEREELQRSGKFLVRMDMCAANALIGIGQPALPMLAAAVRDPRATRNLLSHAVNILVRMSTTSEVIAELYFL